MKLRFKKTAASSIPRAPEHGQRGMALVFALVILLILTILGVSSLRTSSLEQLMSGNTQEQTRAFEAADSGLSRALNDMTTDPTIVNPGSFATTQYTYTVSTGTGTQYSTAVATVQQPIPTGLGNQASPQVGPPMRSNTPTGSNVCMSYYDQQVIGATNGTFAQENLHQGLASGAPCPAAP